MTDTPTVPPTEPNLGTVAFGAVAASPVADAVKALLKEQGYAIIDVSEHNESHPTWPSVGQRVANVVTEGQASTGIALCWTGSGVAISASTVPGARAAFCSAAAEARNARQWHDANVLALSLWAPLPTVVDTVRAWLDAVPFQDSPHIQARADLASLAHTAVAA